MGWLVLFATCIYIDRSHFKVFTRVVPIFSVVMPGEFSRRSVKKTGDEVFSSSAFLPICVCVSVSLSAPAPPLLAYYLSCNIWHLLACWGVACLAADIVLCTKQERKNIHTKLPCYAISLLERLKEKTYIEDSPLYIYRKKITEETQQMARIVPNISTKCLPREVYCRMYISINWGGTGGWVVCHVVYHDCESGSV